MRKTLSISLLLLATVAASAQPQAAWQQVAPSEEEFMVLMPTRESAFSRVLPFTDQLKLVQPVYEVSADGLHFMVVSFEKWRLNGQPELLKTFDGFAKGFEHAVRQSGERDGNTLESEEAFTLEGMKIRPYRVRMSGKEGVARLYEAAKHFYAVVVLGATYGDARVDRFLKSFKVKTNAPKPVRTDDPNDMTALMTMVPPSLDERMSQPAPPEDPWPIHRAARRPRAPVSAGVLQGKVISKPQPEYPAIARAARASGAVVVQITFDEEGKVIFARAISGHPLLQQAAVDAAYKARFSPVRLSGQAVKVTGTLIYNFVLSTLPGPPDS